MMSKYPSSGQAAFMDFRETYALTESWWSLSGEVKFSFLPPCLKGLTGVWISQTEWLDKVTRTTSIHIVCLGTKGYGHNLCLKLTITVSVKQVTLVIHVGNWLSGSGFHSLLLSSSLVPRLWRHTCSLKCFMLWMDCDHGSFFYAQMLFCCV